MVLCISGWDDSGLGSPDVAFFWSGIGIVKARGCHLEFWFWLGIARIQDLSITSSCVFGSGASDWEYVAGGVDSETLHRNSSLCARYRIVLDRRLDGFLA